MSEHALASEGNAGDLTAEQRVHELNILVRLKERRIAELEEALRPFARRADAYEVVDRDTEGEDWGPMLLGDLRRARSALTDKP